MHLTIEINHIINLYRDMNIVNFQYYDFHGKTIFVNKKLFDMFPIATTKYYFKNQYPYYYNSRSCVTGWRKLIIGKILTI